MRYAHGYFSSRTCQSDFRSLDAFFCELVCINSKMANRRVERRKFGSQSVCTCSIDMVILSLNMFRLYRSHWEHFSQNWAPHVYSKRLIVERNGRKFWPRGLLVQLSENHALNFICRTVSHYFVLPYLLWGPNRNAKDYTKQLWLILDVITDYGPLISILMIIN